MISLSRIMHRGGSRGLLLGAVGLLVLIKLGLWLQETYQADLTELESRQANLAKSRRLTGKIPELRSQLQQIEDERERLRKYLFTGANEENIISAMQLDIQALVTTAGLEVETIRPLKQKNPQESGGEVTLGEVAIKTSLSGTLAGYQTFLAELYRSPKVYKIEAVTLSPFKKAEVKMLIDLRGYYVIAAPEAAVTASGGGTTPPVKESGATPSVEAPGVTPPAKESGANLPVKAPGVIPPVKESGTPPFVEAPRVTPPVKETGATPFGEPPAVTPPVKDSRAILPPMTPGSSPSVNSSRTAQPPRTPGALPPGNNSRAILPPRTPGALPPGNNSRAILPPRTPGATPPVNDSGANLSGKDSGT